MTHYPQVGDSHFFLNPGTSTFLSIDPDADCNVTCVDPLTDKIFYNDSNNILAQWLIGDQVIYHIFGGGSSIGGLTDGTSYYLANMSAVPIPAAIWLFGTAIIGLGFARRRKHT